MKKWQCFDHSSRTFHSHILPVILSEAKNLAGFSDGYFSTNVIFGHVGGILRPAAQSGERPTELRPLDDTVLGNL